MSHLSMYFFVHKKDWSLYAFRFPISSQDMKKGSLKG